MSLVRFDVGRSCLELTGGDRLDFLQRMSTNDVGGLAPGEARVTLLLERTGRLVDRVVVYETGDATRMICTAERRAAAREWIEKYVIVDDVEVKELDLAVAVVFTTDGDLPAAFGGPEAPAVGGTSGDLTGDGGGAIRAGDGRGEIVHLVAPADHAAWAELPAGDLAEWERRRVTAAEPAFGPEWTDRTIPLEAGMLPDISFTKGCFLGQEVIARLFNYKRVKRHLVPVRWDGAPAADAELLHAGETAGRITSAVATEDGARGLAQVGPDFTSPGTELELASGETVSVLAAEPTEAS